MQYESTKYCFSLKVIATTQRIIGPCPHVILKGVGPLAGSTPQEASNKNGLSQNKVLIHNSKANHCSDGDSGL